MFFNAQLLLKMLKNIFSFMRIVLCFMVCFMSLNCQENKLIELNRVDFSLSYPSSLELEENIEGGLVFALKTYKKNENDTFIENLNLATKNIGNSSFDDFIHKTVQDISNVGEIIEQKKLTINGRECYRLIFNLSQSSVNLKFIQDYYLKDKKIYVLTFSSEENEFNEYYNQMNNIMKSFIIK